MKPLPIIRLFPNILTLIALCAGMGAIKFALDHKWENAVIYIIIAAFFDAMDGRIARLLKVTSNFGAQLDSLADFLNFGIAPSLILYIWKVHTIAMKGVGWAVALLYIICCALRLARFNSNLDEDEQKLIKRDKFFVGVPSTVGACLVLIPMMLSFQCPDLTISPILVAIYMSVIAIAMVSRMPTISAKNLVIRREFVSLILAGCGIIVALIIIEPWLTLPFLGLTYIAAIPFGIIKYKRAQNALISTDNIP